MDYNAFMEYIFKGMAGILFSIFAWIGLSMKNDLSRVKRDTAAVKDDLAAHKLHVSEQYLKTNTMEGVHQRFDSLEADIKKLLERR
jgi:hypothetical protein